MKKSISLAALYFVVSTATANSLVPLSGGGNVAPVTSLNLSLNGLVPNVIYSVICYIDTNYPFQYILLGSSFTDTTSKIISYSLNGNYVTQDQLIAGHNLVVIDGQFTNPSTGQLIFTNLDQANSFTVHGCFGLPMQGIPNLAANKG